MHPRTSNNKNVSLPRGGSVYVSLPVLAALGFPLSLRLVKMTRLNLDNFPADKAIVLPNIRSEVEDISIESESILETVYLESSGEDEDYIEDPDRPFGANDQLNKVSQRLRDQGRLEESSLSSRPPAVSATAAAPSLRPRPKPKASPQRIFRDLTAADLQRLELRIFEGQGPIEGARAVISWDHHQVLDTFRISAKKVVFQRQVTGSILKETRFPCCGRPYFVSHCCTFT